MWVYSTTQATSAGATWYSRTVSGSGVTETYNAGHLTANSASATDAATFASSTSGTLAHNAWETFTTFRSSNSSSGTGSNTATNGSGSYTQSASGSYQSAASLGFTRSTWGTTTANGLGTTTASSESTVTKSRDSYASTTTTETAATNRHTTSTLATTRQITTTAAGPTTATTSQNTTATTSTTQAQTVARTTLAYAVSALVTAPESLVAISEVEPTEQGWSVTAADSAGYASHVASTFTKRTGVVNTSTSVVPTVGTAGFTTTATRVTGVVSTVTLTTTQTTSASDTFCPGLGVYPETATSTRSFGMLTTVSLSATVPTTGTVTSSLNYPSSHYVTTVSTYRAFWSSTMPVTINASPTSTVSAAWHATWFASSLVTMRVRDNATFATSRSASSGYSANDPTTENATSTLLTTSNTTETINTTTSVAATTTVNLPAGTTIDNTTGDLSLTASGILSTTGTSTYSSTFTTTSDEHFSETWEAYESTSATTYTFGSTAGTTADDGAGNRTISSTSSFADWLSESYSFFSQRTTFVNTISLIGSSSTSDFSSGTLGSSVTWSYSTTFTTEPITDSTTASATTSFTQATTTNVTASEFTTSTAPGTQTSAESSSAIEGISFTFPLLYSRSSFGAALSWTAHGFEPRAGFRHPLSLGSADQLFSELHASPGLSYPYAASQDFSGGAMAPLLWTNETRYESGATSYTAVWRTSDSRLHFTARSTGSTSTTGAASFAGSGSVSWFSHGITTAQAAASKIGGVAARAEYPVAVMMLPGVRCWTTQSNGTASASSTSWLTAPTFLAGSNVGGAFPERTESAFSVTTRQTSWSYDTALSQGASTGDTADPVLTLSLNPNL